MWTKTSLSCIQSKSRNTPLKYLLGDNLKQPAKDVKRSEEITKKYSYRKDFEVQVSIIHKLTRKNLF